MEVPPISATIPSLMASRRMSALLEAGRAQAISVASLARYGLDGDHHVGPSWPSRRR